MIWLGSQLPVKFRRNVRRWEKLGYNVKLWTEPLADMVNQDVFERMVTWAGKSDVMRLEILHRFGGIYTDCDSYPLKPLPIEEDLVCMTSTNGYIANETIYATPQHPAVGEAITKLKKHIKTVEEIGRCNIWDLAGATYITPIFKKYRHKKFSRQFIGPENMRNERTIICHSYEGSWASGIEKSVQKPIDTWYRKRTDKPQAIPKKMFCIWIGDESKRPDDLLQSWKDKHPDWQYKLLGNKEVFGRKWRNQSMIDTYANEGRWAGVADVVRYEVLYEHGGFVHPADSLCLEPIDELIDGSYDALAVYENETVRPGLVSPLYGCSKHNQFVKTLIDNMPKKPPLNSEGISKAPWQVTGNLYMQRMIAMQNYEHLKVFPSYTFNPIHHTGLRYKGNGKVYAVQQWGSTNDKIYAW